MAVKDIRSRFHLPARWAEQPRRWWFIPPVVLGVLILVLAIVFAPGTARIDAEPAPLPVRVMLVDHTNLQPKLKGFGEIQSRHTWHAIAQVAGKVAWRHPALLEGATFAAGTKLIELEPLDYEVAETSADARLRAALAAQAEVDSREQDLAMAIEIESRALSIAKQKYERNVELAEQGHISEIQLDNEERELLRQQQTVQNLRTEANLLPAQARSARARVEEAKAALAKAAEDLNRTVFRMPFDGRIAQFDADDEQFVAAGTSILTAASTRDVELLLETPYEHLVARFPTVMADPSLLSQDPTMLSARLRYQTSVGDMVWQGHVSRIDPGLSADSRSARVYVQVDLDPAEMPPAANLYVHVDIIGPELVDQIVIPRLAWRAGAVLIADADNRLERRTVTPAFAFEDRLVVRDGLSPGDRLILTDVLFPAQGMRISPIEVNEAAAL